MPGIMIQYPLLKRRNSGNRIKLLRIVPVFFRFAKGTLMCSFCRLHRKTKEIATFRTMYSYPNDNHSVCDKDQFAIKRKCIGSGFKANLF